MQTNLPPEAYSKELVTEAFNWLQSQPESVRDLIQTKEQLVSIYMNEQRKQQADAPVSSKQFVSDLKTLAKGMEAFDKGDDSWMPPPAPQASPSPTLGKDLSPQTTRPPTPPQNSPTQQNPTVSQPSPTQNTPKRSGKLYQPTNAQKTAFGSHDMDPRTRQMVQEIHLRFNMSSDAEALRFLVALGYEKLNKI